MKRVLFILTGSIVIMGFSVSPASAWVDKGHFVKNSSHNYTCTEGYCSKSIDPDDPSASVGDKVLSNYPDRGVLKQVITSIQPVDTDSDPTTPPSIQYVLIDDLSGDTDYVDVGQ